MGIDVELWWQGMTAAERSAQIPSPSNRVGVGDLGALHEENDGEPYATHVLVPEAFFKDTVDIPAQVLRARLPQTLLTAAERGRKVYDEEYHEGHPILRAFVEFVELAERKESETGHAVMIRAMWCYLSFTTSNFDFLYPAWRNRPLPRAFA